MADIVVEIPQEYMEEMTQIKKSLSQYPGYKDIAKYLGYYVPTEITAGLIGCIIPESGTDHTILNKKEYNGNGASGTSGWNCGEGLVQWTYWKNKLPLIEKYNADSRSTQKLPTTWDDYKKGEPVNKNGKLHAVQDGQHIAGLTLNNQMLFLTIYYRDLIKKLQGETNLAVIVAKIYQQKAGIGYYKDISDPVERAYTTSKNKYPSSSGNHYLQSLKIANEYLNAPVNVFGVEEEPVNDEVVDGEDVWEDSLDNDTNYNENNWESLDDDSVGDVINDDENETKSKSSDGNKYYEDETLWGEKYTIVVGPDGKVTYPNGSVGQLRAGTNGEVVFPDGKVAYLPLYGEVKKDKQNSDNDRKNEFEALRNKMTSDAPDMGRDIINSSELYDSNILKNGQESKMEIRVMDIRQKDIPNYRDEDDEIYNTNVDAL